MKVVAVIPARYASTRFPAKALAAETGRFLVQHVYEQVRQAARIGRVVVATDDERVAKAVRSFDGEVVMTRTDHVSGTDRVGEAAGALGLGDDDIVLNVQGDEPEISPDSLDRLVEQMTDPSRDRDEAVAANAPGQTAGVSPSRDRDEAVDATRGEAASQNRDRQGAAFLTDQGIEGPRDRVQDVPRKNSQLPLIGTIAAPFDDAGPREGPGSPLDPNCVKVVVDEAGRALYFSRSPIPYPREGRGVIDRPSRWLLHMGVYAFRMAALRRVVVLPPTELERTESLEQLRWLHAGLPIHVVVVKEKSVGIDTPQDYAAFLSRYRAANRRRVEPVV